MPNKDQVNFMDAKLKQLLSVRYVGNNDNLTEEQKSSARTLQHFAYEIAERRVDGRALDGLEHWMSRYNDLQMYAWAVCADTDPYTDLLEPDDSDGVFYRRRLPGVTVHDVECRQHVLKSAFSFVRKRLIDRQTKRGSAR